MFLTKRLPVEQMGRSQLKVFPFKNLLTLNVRVHKLHIFTLMCTPFRKNMKGQKGMSHLEKNDKLQYFPLHDKTLYLHHTLHLDFPTIGNFRQKIFFRENIQTKNQ